MAKHAEVTSALGTLVYFCDPASPWQRASNENANGLLRHDFPNGADLSTVEQAEVRSAADEINGRPRAVLDWDSAAARFASIQTVAALQTMAVSDRAENTARLSTNGDNSPRLSTATATKGAIPTAPQLSREITRIDLQSWTADESWLTSPLRGTIVGNHSPMMVAGAPPSSPAGVRQFL
jgi:hypothetical protein